MATAPSARTLAHAPGECCFTAVKHQGEPAGQPIMLGPLNTYISEPLAGSQVASGAKKNNVILFLADIFGPLYLNNKLLQDYFASHGYTVLGPDYLFGDSAVNYVVGSTATEESRSAWIQSLRQPAKDAFSGWFDAVKEKFGSSTVTNYFAVGYCFGAPFTMNLAATDEIAAAALAHPAFIDEEHFRNLKSGVPVILSLFHFLTAILSEPLFLSCAETDFTFPLDSRRRAEDILVEMKAVYHFQVFSGVAHGFAVRGDLGDQNTRWAKEQSANGIVGWFERFTTV